MRKHLLTAAAISIATTLGSAALADAHRAPAHAIALLSSERAADVIRAQHIRFVGEPYLYNGRYIARCFDESGRLAYCAVDPYYGAFLGVHASL